MDTADRKNRLIYNSILIFLILLIVVLNGIALRDCQMAKGIGLFVSMQFNSDNRLLFDLVVDVLLTATILIVALVPALFIKDKKVEGFYVTVMGIVGFIPILDLSSLVHLLWNPAEIFNLSIDVTGGHLIKAILYGLDDIYISLGVLGVVIVMCYLIKSKRPSKKHIALLAGALAMAICAICFASAAFIFQALSVYCLLIVFVDMLMLVKGNTSSVFSLFDVFYGLMFLRSLYMVISLLNAF